MPDVSVVVAAYNAEPFLEDCLGSLLQLDYPAQRLELVCVDNGSTDRTPEILRRFATRVRVLYEATRGAAAARNRGVMESRGEVVAFTDADCVVERDWLRQLVQPLRDESVGVAGGRILARRPANAIERFGEAIHDHAKAINELAPYAITMNWASRRSVLDTVGPFDERLLRGQDVDLAYRIVQAGFRLQYVPEAVIYHRNERTPWGLFHEGYVHGYHAQSVLALHAQHLDGKRGPRARRWIAQYMGLAKSGPDWSRKACALVFTLGKVVGELHRGSR